MDRSRAIPKQQRARKTVERILQATKTLLSNQGIDGVTTNKIAEVACINVATLYQYFPNKEAVIEAILDQYTNNVTMVLDAMMDTMMDMSIEEACHTWMYAAIDLYDDSEGFIPELFAWRDGEGNNVYGTHLETTLMEAGRRFLMKKRDEIDSDNLNASIYVAFNAAFSVLSKHVFHPAGYLTNEEVVEELTRMIVRYFKP